MLTGNQKAKLGILFDELKEAGAKPEDIHSYSTDILGLSDTVEEEELSQRSLQSQSRTARRKLFEEGRKI